jgi:outer membrane protein OmpA-like peptidoglycan-associated protein
MYPLPDAINTVQHEELGRWNVDGNSLVFTRISDNRTGLYIARFDTKGDLTQVEPFPFDTIYNGGGHTISPDGKSLVFTLCKPQEGLGGCDLYISHLKNGKWTSPRNMGPAINSSGWDAQPVFGADGSSIFFVSSQPGGYGGRDIWMANELLPGTWTPAINVGPGINTFDNEGSPYIHFDGRTMYFMRDGHGGFGGYDLYIAHLGPDGRWGQAENMGGTINTDSNEGGLAIHPDGKTALITRATTAKANDMFKFKLPEKFRAAPLQALHVLVKDDQTLQALKARLEIYEVDKFDTIRLSQWSDEKGKISTSIQKNKKYGLIVDAEGYLPYSENLKADSSTVRELVIRMISLNAAKDKVMVMHNVFFETGSAALLPGSDPELKKLLLTLKKNADMKIEIRGHTDNTGSHATNQLLSESRAKSVYSYLTSNGIDPSRLTYLGFGETQPKADNATAEGRRQNRRTEFKVISN